MRIFLASDIHGYHGKLKSALERESFDIVVLAGDLSHAGSLREIENVLRTARAFGKPIFFVPGNMDPPHLLEEAELEGCINLHGRVYNHTLKLGGLGGGNISPFNTPTELREEEIARVLSGLRSVDVLVSHPPPFNTKLDMIGSGAHVGSKAVREYIERYQPTLCVCGHIHESPGIDKVGRTVIVNAGPMMAGRYATIDLGDGVNPSLKAL